jgi:hypothetical protein
MADEFQCKKMHCHQNSTKNKQVRQTSYKLHGHTLDNEEASKYLGVAININLSSLVFGLCSCCVQILLLFSAPVLWI